MSTLRTKPSPPSSPFGRRLRKARENANLALDHAAVFIDLALAGDGPSRETIRRWESGVVPEEDVKALELAALASVYGVDLASLSPSAAKRLTHQSALIPSTPSKNPRPRSGARTTTRRYATAA